MAGAVN